MAKVYGKTLSQKFIPYCYRFLKNLYDLLMVFAVDLLNLH